MCHYLVLVEERAVFWFQQMTILSTLCAIVSACFKVSGFHIDITPNNVFSATNSFLQTGRLFTVDTNIIVNNIWWKNLYRDIIPDEFTAMTWSVFKQ